MWAAEEMFDVCVGFSPNLPFHRYAVPLKQSIYSMRDGLPQNSMKFAVKFVFVDKGFVEGMWWTVEGWRY